MINAAPIKKGSTKCLWRGQASMRRIGAVLLYAAGEVRSTGATGGPPQDPGSDKAVEGRCRHDAVETSNLPPHPMERFYEDRTRIIGRHGSQAPGSAISSLPRKAPKVVILRHDSDDSQGNTVRCIHFRSSNEDGSRLGKRSAPALAQCVENLLDIRGCPSEFRATASACDGRVPVSPSLRKAPTSYDGSVGAISTGIPHDVPKPCDVTVCIKAGCAIPSPGISRHPDDGLDSPTFRRKVARTAQCPDFEFRRGFDKSPTDKLVGPVLAIQVVVIQGPEPASARISRRLRPFAWCSISPFRLAHSMTQSEDRGRRMNETRFSTGSRSQCVFFHQLDVIKHHLSGILHGLARVWR